MSLIRVKTKLKKKKRLSIVEYKYSGSRNITEYCSLLDNKRFNTANINRKMRSWFILAFSLLLTANATNGTKSADGKTFVCNQYNGQNFETNQAIKKIDKKRDKIIEMLQPSPLTGKKLFEQSFVMNLLLNSSILQE